MSNRVQFVTDSGAVFFECHPAEVRFAKTAIEHQRAKDLIPLELKPYINTLPEVLAKEPIYQGEWTGGLLVCMVDLFAIPEKRNRSITHVCMNSVLYAEIRKLNKNEIDIETRVEILNTGLMAYLWGAKFFITNKVPDNIVIVASHPEVRHGNNPNDKELDVVSFKFSKKDEEMDLRKELEKLEYSIYFLRDYLNKKKIVA